MQHIYACDTTIAVGFVLSQFKFQILHKTPVFPPYLLINHSSAHKEISDCTVVLCKHADNTLNHTINLTVGFVWVLSHMYIKATKGFVWVLSHMYINAPCPFSGGFPGKTYSASS